MIKTLEGMGYEDWTLFDNFGELVIRTKEVLTVRQLIEYVWKQNT